MGEDLNFFIMEFTSIPSLILQSAHQTLIRLQELWLHFRRHPVRLLPAKAAMTYGFGLQKFSSKSKRFIFMREIIGVVSEITVI